MIIIYRAKKKWGDMTAEEMYHALRRQHYCNPEEDNKLIHRGEVRVYSWEYESIKAYCKEQYLKKCKEEGVEPKKLPY